MRICSNNLENKRGIICKRNLADKKIVSGAKNQKEKKSYFTMNKTNSPLLIKNKESSKNNASDTKKHRLEQECIIKTLKNVKPKKTESKAVYKDSSGSSGKIYKEKLVSELDKVITELYLQNSSHATFSDLKDILIGMKMVANSDSDKWHRACSQVWKLLTPGKHGVRRISIRSVKMFVLGVCGIDSLALFEISETDSMPSASTQESKSADEFVFTSAEHLSLVRSKFYEMILHRLTSIEIKDQIKEEMHPFEKLNTFCDTALDVNKDDNLECEIDK